MNPDKYREVAEEDDLFTEAADEDPELKEEEEEEEKDPEQPVHPAEPPPPENLTAIVETKRIVYLTLLMQSQKEKRAMEEKSEGDGVMLSLMKRGKARQGCTHVDLVMKVACGGPEHCEWRATDKKEQDRRAKAGKNIKPYLEAKDHARHHHFMCMSVVQEGVMWYLDRVWVSDKDTSEVGTTVKEYRVFEIDVDEEQYQRLLLFCRAVRLRDPEYDYRSFNATIMASAAMLCKPEEGTWSLSPLSCLKNVSCGCAWVGTNAFCKCFQGLRTMWCCAESRLRAWYHTRDVRDSIKTTPQQLAERLPPVEFCPSFIVHAFDFAGLTHLSSLDPLTSSPDEIAERLFMINNGQPSKGIREVDFRNARKELIVTLFNKDVGEFVTPFESTGINAKIGGRE